MATKSASDALVQWFDDLVRVETRLYNAIGETLRLEHGIAATQYEFLRYFRDHPDSRAADVAANFAAGVGAISKGIDRLVAHGWVARRQNPDDGRSMLVRLTRSGSTLVEAADETFRRRLAELIVPGDERHLAGDALTTLRARLEQDRLGTPIG